MELKIKAFASLEGISQNAQLCIIFYLKFIWLCRSSWFHWFGEYGNCRPNQNLLGLNSVHPKPIPNDVVWVRFGWLAGQPDLLNTSIYKQAPSPYNTRKS